MNHLKFILIPLFMGFLSFAQTKGTINGIITDKENNNEPLPYASVVVKGTKNGTTTNDLGKFELHIPEGKHILQISFVGYETAEVPVTIVAGKTATFTYAMGGSGGLQLKDVEVVHTTNKESETALLVEQQKAVEIKQSIGAQEISRKGISNVEEGLTKVTGFTKVESRGLFVRGLEDRYNNLLINGLAVPSNSPFKKIVPLDNFPTDVVGYMDIFKTFSPDIYGDFAGGTVNIVTAQPTTESTKISYGVGYAKQNNLTDFLIAYDANNTQSSFGLNGEDRSIPKAFGNVPAATTYNKFGSNWNVDKIKTPLNQSFGISHLGKISQSLRYVFSMNFDNNYQIRTGVDRTFYQGQGVYDNNLSRTEYKFDTQSSVLAGLYFKKKKFTLNTIGLLIRNTSNIIKDQYGYTRNQVMNPNQYIRLNQLDVSTYVVGQVFGNYKLNDKNTIDYGFSINKTTFEQPDRKFLDVRKISEETYESVYGGNNLIRQFLDIDSNHYFSGKLVYNFSFGNDNQHKLSMGYNGFANQLTSVFRFISGVPNGSNSAIVAINTIDATLAQAVQNNIIYYQEGSNAEYKNKISKETNAGFINGVYKATEKLELTGGFRFENSNRTLKYRTISLSNTDPYLKRVYEKSYFLPALNAKYNLNDRTNLRMAFGKTITQPTDAEILPIDYIDADGTSISGNPLLKNSENLILDIKYEFFPSKSELFAVTIFGKNITNPIERVLEHSGTGAGQIITFDNNKEAVLYGLETEFIVKLDRLSNALSNFTWGMNASLMKTDVTVANTTERAFDTFKNRELQGASNWLLNSDIKYEFDFTNTWKNTATLVYNVNGKRIFATGVAGNDHIYESPFHKLDFVWTTNYNKKWDVKFSIDNILNYTYKKEMGAESRHTITEDSLTLTSFKRGTEFSMKLTYSF